MPAGCHWDPSAGGLLGRSRRGVANWREITVELYSMYDYQATGALRRRVQHLADGEEWDVPTGGTRSAVTEFSSASKRRLAETVAAWIAGCQESGRPVAFVTLTVGGGDPRRIDPVTGAFDWSLDFEQFKRAVKGQAKRWSRLGACGPWWVETQQRGAPHVHAYLAPAAAVEWSLPGGLESLKGGWLADSWVRSTGALPVGQHVESMRAADAAVAYMVAEASKLHQRSHPYRGRRWGVVNRAAVSALSVPTVSAGVEHLPLWSAWILAAASTRPFRPAAWVRAVAGMVPHWWIGAMPDPACDPGLAVLEYQGDGRFAIPVRFAKAQYDGGFQTAAKWSVRRHCRVLWSTRGVWVSPDGWESDPVCVASADDPDRLTAFAASRAAAVLTRWRGHALRAGAVFEPAQLELFGGLRLLGSGGVVCVPDGVELPAVRTRAAGEDSDPIDPGPPRGGVFVIVCCLGFLLTCVSGIGVQDE